MPVWTQFQTKVNETLCCIIAPSLKPASLESYSEASLPNSLSLCCLPTPPATSSLYRKVQLVPNPKSLSISQRHLVGIIRHSKLTIISPNLFPMWFFQIFHRRQTDLHIVLSWNIFYALPLLSFSSCHLSCVESTASFSVPFQNADILYMWSVPGHLSHRIPSPLWNVLALTILSIHLQLIISSCPLIILDCFIQLLFISCIVL